MGSTEKDFDVVIVGSGPAGVSAAFPLISAGKRVAMVDGGDVAEKKIAPPEDFLHLRYSDQNQWRWIVGQDFYALRHGDAVSPKLRVPGHAGVFERFHFANRITSDDFVAVGSLSPGGLSNAWGCGVASLSDDELLAFPTDASEMRSSYAAVAKRIGISGRCDDDLSHFFGLDGLAQPPLPIDSLQTGVLKNYQRRRKALLQSSFRLGRARVAALSEPHADRSECNLTGSCLWGCSRRALYNATHDLSLLKKRDGFYYASNVVVESVAQEDRQVVVEGRGKDGPVRLTAKCVVLAAGTLASTRLALMAIDHRQPIAMQSCPTAAFLLWSPQHLGRVHEAAFGLGQLSFAMTLAESTEGFGSLFSTTGIPVTEFVRHVPFGKRYGIDFLKTFLTSCMVGNLFLPGSLTVSSLTLKPDGSLLVTGAYSERVPPLMREAKGLLSRSFRHMRALVVPGSFTVGRPGTDIHYASSLPMRSRPKLGETDAYGKLVGVDDIYVVDGASLPFLPAKSHTLTIMANADRIARHLVCKLSGVNL